MARRYSLSLVVWITCWYMIVTGMASAAHFNDRWYWDRRDEEVRDTSFTIDGRKVGEPTPSDTPDDGSPRPFVRLVPPEDVLKPIVTITDSIDTERGLIKRRRQIPGIRIERYYLIPLDSYVNDNLGLNRRRLWQSEKTQRMKEWQSTEEGGISELDLAIPVGKRFESLVGGTTNINIDGSQRIEFSGKSEYDEGVIATATNTNNKFPSLTMKQEPQFTIRGNIGDRLKIDIKQDAQAGAFANLEENISIKYEGHDNDIIKYIEAGNTSLNLPGATFAGYSGTHQGLFGIRAEAQLGPIEVTTIASQEKGETSSKSFRGSAEESVYEIRDYQYKANTYFFLDFFYMDQFAQSRDDFSRILYDPADSVAVIEVYINDGDNLNDSNEETLAYPGVAWPMDMFTGAEDSARAVEGFYHRMDPSEYYISRELGFIQFLRPIDDRWTVGIYMRTKGDEGRGIPSQEFGRLEYDSTRPDDTRNVFKLIKRKSQRPTDTDTWDLEWKNVYDLGQRNIDLDGLEIKIYREATDGVSRDKQDGIPYIQLLGLDRVDETGSPTSSPDNKVDFNRGLVDRFRGEIIFPLLRPFDSPLPPAGVDGELDQKVPEIYDSANRNERMEATRYYIEVKTSQRQSTIRIEAGIMGILEDSETVTLNGRRLARGTDYRINYMSGEVTFLTEEAMSPNAVIDINYQEQGFAQPMQKTLFGIRGEYDLWDESRLGAVFLFNNESTKDKRVRLGSEPSRTMLFDVDADLNFQPRFLTTAVDRLPGVVANAPSRVRIQAEYARSMPNMNTHGEVYIDDFEGSQDQQISIMRSGWYFAARPNESSAKGSRLKARGSLQWYNPWDRIDSKDIWGDKRETAASENTVHVLSLAYSKSDSSGVADDESYAGITQAFWGTGADLSRARLLEIWARGGDGVLKIDLGSISEDAYENGYLDTEDKPIPGLGQGDGILTEDEDTGLDGLFDRNETGYSEDNRDPAGDNFGYNEKNKNDYSRINGTEGNASDSDRMGIPDTEDINRNGILDTRDSYYEYSIDFGDPFDPYFVEGSIPKGGTAEGWRMFRIPLWNNPQAISDGTPTPPDSTLIEYIRLWVTGADTSFIQIAEMKIVESRWLEQGIFDIDNSEVTTGDDVVQVTTKNIHENTDYESPPGVQGELDRETKIRRNEQSVVIDVENLSPGNAGFIYRNFEKMDFTDYTSLKLYVHGPDEFPPPGSETSPYEFIVRFGGDKDNYYEYRAPVYQGWASENNIEVDFATCTELKLMDEYGFDRFGYAESLKDSLAATMTDSLAKAIADSIALDMAITLEDSLLIHRGGRTYAISGNPSLNNVRIIQFGIRNNTEIEEFTGEVWLDELRMDDLRDMEGTASRASFETDLSGFIQLRGKMQQKSDDFHGMNQKKGSGQNETSWDSNITINLDRFTPRRWNLSLSVTADYRESEALPRLKSGSDIILPEEQKYDFRTASNERKTRISYKKGHDETKTGITGFVTRWAFEKLSLDYDWGERSTIDPNSGTSDLNNQQLRVGYDVAPKPKGFMLLGWMPVLPGRLGRTVSNAMFNYTPSALNYSYVFNEKNTYTTDIDGNVEEPLQIKTTDETLNFSYDPFQAINYDFKISRSNDLYLNQEVSYMEDNKISLTGPDLMYITNKYSYDVVYDEDNDPKYSLSSQLGSRTITFRKSFSANADFAINTLLDERFSGKPRPPRQMEEPDPERPTWSSWFGWFGGDDVDDGTAAADDSTMVTEEQMPVPGEIPMPGEMPLPPEGVLIDENDDIGGRPEDIGAPGETASLRTRMVSALASALTPINFEYRNDQNLNYAGVTRRPGFMARLGRADIPEPDSSSVVSSRNTSTVGQTYNASTRIILPLNIAIRTSTRFNRDERITSSVSELSESTTLPDISLSMTRIEERVPFIAKYVTNMSANSAMSVTGNKSWQNNSPIPNQDRNDLRFSPLLSLNAKVLNQYDVSFSLNTLNQESTNLSGDVTSVSLTSELTTVTTIKYRLNASQGLPLLGLKLKSDIDLTGEFRTESRQTERTVGDEQSALIKDDTGTTFSLNGNYRFSEKLRGGASMMFKTTENITKKVHKIREVKIWCELRF